MDAGQRGRWDISSSHKHRRLVLFGQSGTSTFGVTWYQDPGVNLSVDQRVQCASDYPDRGIEPPSVHGDRRVPVRSDFRPGMNVPSAMSGFRWQPFSTHVEAHAVHVKVASVWRLLKGMEFRPDKSDRCARRTSGCGAHGMLIEDWVQPGQPRSYMDRGTRIVGNTRGLDGCAYARRAIATRALNIAAMYLPSRVSLLPALKFSCQYPGEREHVALVTRRDAISPRHRAGT